MKNRKMYILLLIVFLAFNQLSAMQIFIYNVQSGESITLDVEPADTIDNLKAKIYDIKEIPPEIIILKYSGNTLENNKTLSDYNINKEDTLNMTFTTSIPTLPTWGLIFLFTTLSLFAVIKIYKTAIKA